MARKTVRKWSQAAPKGAVLAAFSPNIESLRAEVEVVLRETIDQARAYRDSSYIDDDGTHYAKGGIWNDRDGRAAEGITKEHVDATVTALRDIGLHFDWDDVDAMLCEFQRTGRFPQIALAAPTDGGLAVHLSLSGEPKSSTQTTFEHDEIVFREHARGWFAVCDGAIHLIIVDSKAACACGKSCIVLRAFESHGRAAESLSKRFGAVVDEESYILRRAIEIAEQFGFGSAAKRRGPKYDDVTAALLVIVYTVYTSEAQSSAAMIRLIEAGLVGRLPSESTLRRYKASKDVTAMLRRMCTIVRRDLEQVGISLDADDAQRLSGCVAAQNLVTLIRASKRVAAMKGKGAKSVPPTPTTSDLVA